MPGSEIAFWALGLVGSCSSDFSAWLGFPTGGSRVAPEPAGSGAIRPRHALPFAILLLLAAAAPAATLSVGASIGRTSATLGDQLEYVVTASAPPGSGTTLVGLGAAFARAGLESATTTGSLLATPASPPASAPAAAGEPPADATRTARPTEDEVTTRTWRVVPFRLGEVEISGVAVQFRLADGKLETRPVPPIRIAIGTVGLPGNVQLAEGEMFGVKPPVQLLAARPRRWWLAAAIVLAGLLVSLAIWRPDLLTRWFRRALPPPPPPKPPDAAALDALDRLVSEGLLDRGLVREYFGRLSEILRGYLDGRFTLHSMEATTDELAPVLRRHPLLGRQWLEPLRKFLVTCDLAKFARHTPPRPLTDELTAFVRSFVRETRQPDEPPAPAAAPGVPREGAPA